MVALVMEKETSNIKYRAQHADERDFKGLCELCCTKKIEYGYVITKSPNDFGLLTNKTIAKTGTFIMRIPATLLCYWLGEGEATNVNLFD